MTSYLQSLLTVIAPILIFFFPGIGLTDAKSERNMLAYVSRLLLWSFTSVILVTFAGSFLALPRGAAAGILICITAGGVWYHRRTFFTLPTLWYSFGAATLMVAPLAAFSIPFLIQKQGLPTGDAQKAIYWAQSISQHGNLPDYSLSYL
ncbi:MAG: hypothetical protein HYZ62_02025, partial [Candidatus Andersenbacteria bacterium]|nr:hypothetical protein [Candidatus Andersenbacteria bacterium]